MCSFYQYLHITLIVLTVALCVTALPNRNLKVSAAGLDLVSPTSAGVRFYALLNNTSSSEAFQVDLVPVKCCLDSAKNRRDCRSMDLVGLHLDTIPVATTLNIKLIAPLLNPLNRKGNCIVNLDSKNVARCGKSMREAFKIDFDTNLDKLDADFYRKVDGVAKCNSEDEDPLSNCEPVDCDIHYNGHKSFFNRKIRQCSRVPKCVPTSRMDNEIIYNPRSNRCQTTLLVNNDDIEFIKSLQEENATLNPQVDQVIDNDIPSFSQDLDLSDASSAYFTWAFAGNKNIAILGSIVLLQFLALMFVCCRYTKTCRSGKAQKKNKIKSIFHCQQNASDTTPLIGLSNTETTDYINQSFPSNTALPVKSYKSIQREFNDVKKALSDDVLDKCLNRRTWKPSSHRDLIPEYESAKIIEDLVEKLTDCSEGSSKLYKPQYQQAKENRLSYVDETIAKNIMIYDDDDEYHDITKGQESEEEIKCHNYSADKSSTKSTPNDEESSEKTDFVQNSAQINFSSDTIDRLLEKKSIYMAPMELSQYSFPDTKTTASTASSDTVRDRIKARWCKLFPKTSKSCSKSDPGNDKSEKLELLHMSRISIHSSSINEIE